MENTGDSWCVVRSIRLEFTGAQGLLKGHLMIHAVIDGVGLVAIGNDGFVAKYADGCVDDKAWIRQLGRIKCLGADAFTLFHKDTVTAVDTAAHNEISSDCMCSIRSESENDSAARICIG